VALLRRKRKIRKRGKKGPQEGFGWEEKTGSSHQSLERICFRGGPQKGGERRRIVKGGGRGLNLLNLEKKNPSWNPFGGKGERGTNWEAGAFPYWKKKTPEF